MTAIAPTGGRPARRRLARLGEGLAHEQLVVHRRAMIPRPRAITVRADGLRTDPASAIGAHG